MSRLVLAVDPTVGVSASDLAQAWNGDADTSRHGRAETEPAGPASFLPDLAELVTIPLAVNLASNVVYDLARRLLTRLRAQKAAEPAMSEELEIVEHRSGDDRLVIIRMRRDVR